MVLERAMGAGQGARHDPDYQSRLVTRRRLIMQMVERRTNLLEKELAHWGITIFLSRSPCL